MKKGKRFIGAMLAFVMLVTMIPMNVFATETKTDTSVNTDDLTVEGTNGFGTLLSQEIQESQEESSSAEDEYEDGYSIVDLSFDGAVATVEYSSLKTATLVVALYSEDGLKMLTSGKTMVGPEQNVATVTIKDDMPEYFLASAYLIDTYDMLPLCASYETPMYTREMQELLNSTVDDYDQDQVLNLGEDKNTNFAVYDDSTILIEPVDGVNTVKTVDDEKGVYVIENADEQVKNLREGDVFVYPYGENQMLIAKVGAISTDGNKVTITSNDLQMEEVFSYVKIENSGDTNDVQIDVSTVDEGLVYEGIKTENGSIQTRDYDVSISHNTSLKYKVDHKNEEKGVEVSGSLEFSIELKVEVYHSPSYTRVEVALSPTMKAGAQIECEVAMDAVPVKIGPWKMGSISLPFMYGAAMIKFTPEFVMELSGSVSLEAEMSANLGFYYETGKNGTKFNPINSSSCDGLELSGEVSLFVGLQLTPKVEVLKGSVLEVELKGKIGLEATSTPTVRETDANADVHHVCDGCFDGDLSAVLSTDVSMNVLGKDALKKLGSFNLSFVDWKAKVADYYFCYSHKEFDWGNCPYYECLTTVYVKNSNGKPLQNAEVYVDDQKAKTNEKGIATFYLTYGTHDITAEYEKLSAKTTVGAYKAQKVTMTVMPEGASRNVFTYVTPDDCIDDIIIYKSGKCGDDLYWNLDGVGHMIISGTGPMWNYSFESRPSWHDECDSITEVIIGCYMEDKVTSIGNYAFYDCVNLRSVKISDGVTSIGEGAFLECENLSDLSIPDTVTSISARAYEFCTSLTSVEIPTSVTTIGAGAFEYCESLTSVEIPNSVTTIEGTTFFACTNLTSVLIPNSVTAIGVNSFGYCANLTSVTIPDSVTIIAPSAFQHCNSLSNIMIGKNVTSIGGMAFSSCESLTDIVFRGNAPSIDEGAFTNVEATAYYPAGNSTWVSDEIKSSYGGDVTWVPYTLDSNGNMIINEAAAVTMMSDIEPLSEIDESTDIVIESVGEEAPNLHAVYDGEYSSMVVDTYTLKIASFSGLVPGEQYILLAMVNIDAVDPLDTENLLYIDQGVALEDGTLEFKYIQRTPTDTSYVVACGPSNKNLKDAEISFPEMIVDGEPETVNPTVIYDGKTLIEGQDYTILGTVSVSEPGTYTCYIRGIGNYSGLVECTFTVSGPVSEVASGTCGDNLTWTLYDNGKLTISGTGAMTNFSSMSSVPWYNMRYSIITVNIEHGVTTIGDLAFYDCGSLTSVTIPDSVTIIGDFAFYDCDGLSGVTIPTSVRIIGGYVFRGCNGLTNVTIPASISAISICAFQYCANLTSVTIPDSVTNIKAGAFEGCSSLTNVTIPDSVTTIGNGAFYACSSLTCVEIPDSVTTIGELPFGYCSSLTGIYVDENNPSYSSDDRGVLFDKEKTKLIQAPGTISVSYEIPESVTNIGIYAFSGCTGLSQITFTGAAPSIEENAFLDVTANVYYSSDKSNWTEEVLQNYGGNITWIIVCNEHNYEAVVTEPTCTEQGYTTYTCSKCGDSYVADETEAHGHAYESVTTEDGEVIYTCIICGDSYTDTSQTTLQYVVDEDHIRITGYTGSAKELVIPDEIEGLPVTIIDAYAFRNCSTLISISIPKSVIEIGNSAFELCSSLTRIYVDENNANFSSDSYGVLFDKQKTVLMKAPLAISGAYVIPESVTTIKENAFFYCRNLKSVVIPGSVSTIEGWAFQLCENLKTVDIRPGVKEIGYASFSSTGLTSLELPESVTIIGEDAFSLCQYMTSVVIPASVTSIGNYAFMWCDRLEEIKFLGDAPYIGENSFDGVTATAYYVEDNPTWSAEVMQNYAGKLTWVSYKAEEEEKPLENPFIDVPENEYYYQPVLWAVDQGITAGLKPNQFAPEDSCTRGQVVTFLWRAFDCPEPQSTTHSFTDLKSSEYYYKAVLWAVENGITAGLTKTTFAPDATVTRGQFVTFLHRAEGKPAYTASNPFTDLKTGEYYYDAVLWAVENGVTSGLKPTLFGPEEPCTRGQVVTFLYRAYGE